MQPETRFKMKVKDLLAKIPGVWHVKIEQRSIRGIPDILGCAGGFIFALELKVGDNTTDALQEYTLERIRGAGGYAVTLTPENLDDVMDVIRRLSDVITFQKEVSPITKPNCSSEAGRNISGRARASARKRN